MEYKTITIKEIGKVEIDVNNVSRCKICKNYIHWGITHKPSYVPLDYIDGVWKRHKCKKLHFEDRLQEFKEQSKRDRWWK